MPRPHIGDGTGDLTPISSGGLKIRYEVGVIINPFKLRQWDLWG